MLIALALVLASVATQPQKLTVDAAVALALRQHPDVRAATARVNAAKAEGAGMVARLHPQVSVSGLYKDGTGDMIFATPAMPTQYYATSPDRFGAGAAMLMAPLYTGGRLAAARAAARANVGGSEADRATIEADVRQGVRVAFADALRKRDYVGAFEAQLVSQQELLRTTKASFDAGKLPEAFLLRAQAEVARAEGQLATARADADVAMAGLREAVGMDQTAPLDLVPWTEAPTPASDLVSATSQALATRPELTSGRARVDSARADARSAKGSMLPEIDLMAMQMNMKAQSEAWASRYAAALVFSFPLFDSGMRRADLRKAEALSTEQAALLERRKLAVEADVARAWAAWSSSDKVVAAAEAAAKSFEEAYRVGVVRYEAGKAVQVEVTDLMASLTRSRAELADARLMRLVAWSNLMRAMGK
jgi:outer membrane protein